VYTQNLWSFLDVAFVLIFLIYLVLRVHGWRIDDIRPAQQAFDVLALAAPVVVPRLAFNTFSDNLVFLSLRSMMADFLLLTALAGWCFFGFVLSLLWLGEGRHPIMYVEAFCCRGPANELQCNLKVDDIYLVWTRRDWHRVVGECDLVS
jgi:acyl-CoA dehydrogenase